jgi:hypothetical protein
VAVVALTTTCTPATCVALELECGAASDRCGGLLSCGGCTSNEFCGGDGTPNECGGCRATTCAAEGVGCGQTYDDVCNLTIDCGPCTLAEVCD